MFGAAVVVGVVAFVLVLAAVYCGVAAVVGEVSAAAVEPRIEHCRAFEWTRKRLVLPQS